MQTKSYNWPYINRKVPKTKNNNELIITAECLPNFHKNFYNEFIKGNKIILICPKNGSEQECLNEITQVLYKNPPNSITICRIKLKCCQNLTNLVRQAMKITDKNIIINEKTYDTNGNLVY